MAIVNITRLQVRRGNLVDLPQLASAELGWAIDEQKLFIGNGSLAEGAPAVGNTEILTEHSDIIGSLGAYTYEGNSATTITNAVQRTLQDRLDDYVSVRAFGADGGGIECSTEINLALTELYGTNSDQQTRVGLYFPAGVYLINSPLDIYPNAILFGDGMGRTIIRSSGAAEILRTVDSQGNYGALMNTALGLGDTLPLNILIRDMTLENTAGNDLTNLKSTTDLTFEGVEFKGAYDDITSTTNSTQRAIVTVNEPAAVCGRFTFTGCRFTQLGIPIALNEDLHGMTVDRCLFKTCFVGLDLTNIATPPDPVLITNSYFNYISRTAISASGGAKFNSIANTFVDVGNRGTGLPVDAVLVGNSDGCVSWLDRFDRLASTSVPRFTNNSVSTDARLYVDAEDRLRFGLKDTLRTRKITLVADPISTLTGSLTDILVKPTSGYNGNTYFQEVRYVLRRESETRSGVIRLAINGNDVDLSESYNYAPDVVTNSPSGFPWAIEPLDVTFTASMNGSSEVTIDYSIEPGTDATLIVSPTNLLDE